ncbi:MAG: hypothetical protein ACK57D_10740 [Sphingobacteriales bacterium]
MIRIKAMAFICWIAIVTACNNKTETATKPEASASSSTFKGEIKEDVRDSKPDWEPYIRKKAPEGAPNILFILSLLTD